MTTDSSIQSRDHQSQVEALQSRIIHSAEGVFTSFSIYIGHKLNFYRILTGHRGMTSTELAAEAETSERYTREWLEQQTTVGILDVQNSEESAFDRRYTLSEAHAEVLAEQNSVNYFTPLTELLVGVTRPLRSLLDCYRYGGGVPFADYSADMRVGQAGINRMTFLSELGETWIPAIPRLEACLREGKAHVMDFGCGCGWSSIGVAKAFPNVYIDAFDLDRASIEQARANAASYHVSERIRFHCEDVATIETTTKYDLFICCETLHDLADPVSALKVAKRHLKADGTALIVDERVADTFMGPGNDLDWMMYGWSILHCLPVGMADGAEHHCGGTGTVMRRPTLERYANEAGFGSIEKLPIENLFFNIYRLNVAEDTERRPQ